VHHRILSPDSEREHCSDHEMHEGRKQTGRRSAHAGSRLKLIDAPGRSRLIRRPSSRTGENPPYGMIGGSRRRRHHSKPGPRLDPTRPKRTSRTAGSDPFYVILFAMMTKDELIIQLIKIALGIAIGAYFVWWSLEVLHRLPSY
jgi:hypothetical protein